MTVGNVMSVANVSITTIIMIASPILVISIIVGLIISIIQTTTSIQEQTLTFVPKVFAILLSILFFGYWMAAKLTNFSIEIFKKIPDLVK